MFKFQSSVAVIIVPQSLSHPILFITTKSSSVNKVIIYKYCIALYGVPWKKEQEAWKYVTDAADGLISYANTNRMLSSCSVLISNCR